MPLFIDPCKCSSWFVDIAVYFRMFVLDIWHLNSSDSVTLIKSEFASNSGNGDYQTIKTEAYGSPNSQVGCKMFW